MRGATAKARDVESKHNASIVVSTPYFPGSHAVHIVAEPEMCLARSACLACCATRDALWFASFAGTNCALELLDIARKESLRLLEFVEARSWAAMEGWARTAL